MQLIQSIPGLAKILSIVIDRELGSIDRFSCRKHFAGYAGTVPKLKSSAGKTHYGKMIKQCNNYLKWAFIEGANVIVRHRHHPAWKPKYVCQIYDRVSRRKGHAIAVGAVAHHLAEAAFWILNRQQPYRPPAMPQASPKQVQGRA